MISSDKIVQAVRWIDKYRKKLISMLLLPVVASFLVYNFSNYIIEILSRPLNGMNLFFLTPMDGIMTKVKISIFLGVIITIPAIVYMIVALAASKLHKKIKRIIRFVIIPFATLAFIGGVLFGYKLVLPTTIKFLLSSGNEFMNPTLRGSDYFSFVMLLLISIGLVFELPLVLVALSRTGFLTYNMLIKKRKVAIFLIIVFVSVITPTPDIFTLVVVSAPMIVLFEISIWWIFLLEKGDRKAIKGGI